MPSHEEGVWILELEEASGVLPVTAGFDVERRLMTHVETNSGFPQSIDRCRKNRLVGDE